MSGFRIATDLAPSQRQPRVKREVHLGFVRHLPCVICGVTPSDPAHLRAGNRLVGKRETGKSEKPSDFWVTPLCREHHDEQHHMGELDFWESHRINNPWQLCLALFAITGDPQLGEAIVLEHQRVAAGWNP